MPPRQPLLVINLTDRNRLSLQLGPKDETGPICQMIVKGNRTILYRWEGSWDVPGRQAVRMNGTFTDAALRRMGFTDTHLELIQAARQGEDNLRKAFELYWGRPLTPFQASRWITTTTLPRRRTAH